MGQRVKGQRLRVTNRRKAALERPGASRITHSMVSLRSAPVSHTPLGASISTFHSRAPEICRRDLPKDPVSLKGRKSTRGTLSYNG